jgi:hypothetical protein
MSDEENKKPRKIDKESVKVLSLPIDLAAVSSSGHGGDEYQPGHRCICVGVPAWSTSLSAVSGSLHVAEWGSRTIQH